jgi:hypothetical protein
MANNAQLDIDTELLAARLSLADLVSERGDLVLAYGDGPDIDLALQLQEADLINLIRDLENLRVCRAVQDAPDVDEALLDRLRLVDEGERDDHAWAVALERQDLLPEQSAAQRALEDLEEEEEYVL